MLSLGPSSRLKMGGGPEAAAGQGRSESQGGCGGGGPEMGGPGQRLACSVFHQRLHFVKCYSEPAKPSRGRGPGGSSSQDSPGDSSLCRPALHPPLWACGSLPRRQAGETRRSCPSVRVCSEPCCRRCTRLQVRRHSLCQDVVLQGPLLPSPSPSPPPSRWPPRLVLL